MNMAAQTNKLPTVLRIDKKVKRLKKGSTFDAKGGFALVFRTELTDGSVVAVKMPKEEFIEEKVHSSAGRPMAG